MNFDQYKEAFTKKASDSGYSEENIQKCLEYAKCLKEQNLPVIYNTSHLSALVGYKKEYIKRAVVYTPYFYRYFKIGKRNGGARIISEPLPSLKEIQKWILRNILQNLKVSPFAKAYRSEIGIVENIRFHKSQPKLLAVDIKDFFPSVSMKPIEQIFLSVGYSNVVSNLLAKLCTTNGGLPQGAPTSPYLSNLFFKQADDRIIQYCLEHDIKYTRYADDLSFSGDFNDRKLLEVINEAITPLGLNLNAKKTRIMKPHQRQVVTGVVVNKKPQVAFNKRNQLRQAMYYIKKFGLQEHMARRNIKKGNYLEHLLGQINFVLHINSNDSEFLEYKKYLNELKSGTSDTLV